LKGFQGTFEAAAEEVSKVLGGSVAAAVGGGGRVAVGFSGGLDSSTLVVCARRHAEVVACTAYAEGSFDGSRAREAARELGVELVATKLTSELVRAELRGLDAAVGGTLMDRSLWCLYSVASRSAAEAGAGVILLGQLSDELFGGYSKYQEALADRGEEAAEAMMRKDVAGYAAGGRARDYDACSRWLPPRFPFEAKEVIELGLSLPVSYKIRDGVRKAVLRRAAELLGVPEELAAAPKKAAQYSSGIQKLLA
jgi:asparagine synthase (glutamine-hydrolysing)